MRVRALLARDLPALRDSYERAGYGYEFPDLTGPLMESALVVEDDAGNLIGAAAAERIVQLYLFRGEAGPAETLGAIRLLHCTMAEELRQKGYRSADAYLPPEIAHSFGRRLMRTFGWIRNLWPSFSIKF